MGSLRSQDGFLSSKDSTSLQEFQAAQKSQYIGEACRTFHQEGGALERMESSLLAFQIHTCLPACTYNGIRPSPFPQTPVLAGVPLVDGAEPPFRIQLRH